MFSSIFRPSRSKRRRARIDTSPFASTFRTTTPPRNGPRDYSSEGEDEDDEDDDEESDASSEEETVPLLPIFDATVLDSLPIYNLTLAIRQLVSEKCETVLSWEQLRSPQVSQFLIRPIQQEIRTNSFSAATIYALMANCLQFTKEIDSNPGNSGTSHTRALICELIAIKLLREYNTRGLIDALSYDFDPLQGYAATTAAPPTNAGVGWQNVPKTQPKSARISCLEIAIRAQAKRFLAHPLVVQQLQAIWNGAVVFHNAADSLHRKSAAGFGQANYGTANQPYPKLSSRDLHKSVFQRKMVTLYNPRDASLFKLSRLRVPRYRNFLSTISYAVLLGLFVAVLVQRSVEITNLEILFWFWAAGYMLDEVVGFNEQGFGLYIASFWNTFDLGILVLLVIHLCLRIYGIVSPVAHKHSTAKMAYDILAADAILLFPRLFSVLDHYRYFSQLIIAFRLMAADLMAVFILILIACSGFFVALALSFGEDRLDDPKSVGFALLQLVLGFTPAAWDRWELYTPLGRAILILFMFITHFVVVTILITVLTNSFMAVVKNAHEEHQFLFAVNTISSVKSDSLFSYVPPLNVLQWSLTPLRLFLPFRQYIYWNRVVIKVTHFPALFSIYLYEKTVLQSSIIDTIDMVENRKRTQTLARLPRLAREPSMATFKQDQALEEVFKRPLDDTLREVGGPTRRKSSQVVNRWMNELGDDEAGPPEEQDPKVVHRLERRKTFRRQLPAHTRGRNFSRRTMSVASDPADIGSNADFFSPMGHITASAHPSVSQLDLPSRADGENGHGEGDDGDDELLTNDADDDDAVSNTLRRPVRGVRALFPDTSQQLRPSPTLRRVDEASSMTSASHVDLPVRIHVDPPAPSSTPRHGRSHTRNDSTTTAILDLSLVREASPSEPGLDADPRRRSHATSSVMTPRSKQASTSTGKKAPKLKGVIRPGLPDARDAAFRSTPNLRGLSSSNKPESPKRRPSLEMDLVSDIGDNKALGGGYVGALPASFAAQMALATGGLRQIQQERQEEQERLSRLVMARMNSLEEGFRGIIHEMREGKKPGHGKGRSGDKPPRTPPQALRDKDRKRLKDRTRSGGTSGTATSVEDASSLQASLEMRKPDLTTSTTMSTVPRTAALSAVESNNLDDPPAEHQSG